MCEARTIVAKEDVRMIVQSHKYIEDLKYFTTLDRIFNLKI